MLNQRKIIPKMSILRMNKSLQLPPERIVLSKIDYFGFLPLSNDILRFRSNSRRPTSSSLGQTHLTRSLPMPPDYQGDSSSPSSPTHSSPTTNKSHSTDKPVRRPL